MVKNQENLRHIAASSYQGHDSVLDISSASSQDMSSVGSNNANEDSKVRIRNMNSLVDNSKKRYRIITVQSKTQMVSEGHKNTVIAHYFGDRISEMCWSIMAGPKSSAFVALLCVTGIVFTIADMTSSEVPDGTSVACALTLPWALLVFGLLKVDILSKLSSVFNVWFLISQNLAMIICIALVSTRPGIMIMMSPLLVVCVLTDAFPQEYRWRVTAFTYASTIAFTIAFDLSMILSLFPIDDSLSFKVNHMEFSGKALAFGCSLNLLAFYAKNVTVMALYPSALIMITSNLVTSRYQPSAVAANEKWDDHDDNLFWWNRRHVIESAERRRTMVWVLQPRMKPVVVRTKNTLVATVFGTAGNRVLWSLARNPFVFLVAIPAIVCFIPIFSDGEGILPNWTTAFVLFAMVTLGPTFGIINVKLTKMLLCMFQVYFLIVMSALLLITLFSPLLDVRLSCLPVLIIGLLFSILLDAYPGSGRFLAGARFYTFKLFLAICVVMYMLSSDAPLRYFSKDVGEINFSGAALCVSAASNLFIFGLRNMYQLIVEPQCLVVLSSLIEYRRVPLDVAELAVYGGVDLSDSKFFCVERPDL